MHRCHECGRDIPPGEGARRELVLGTNTSSTPQGSRTDVRRGMVSLCPTCVPLVDGRLRKESRTSTLWAVAVIGGFLTFMAGGYFFLVKPNLEANEKMQQKVNDDINKARKEQEEFRKKNFGSP